MIARSKNYSIVVVYEHSIQNRKNSSESDVDPPETFDCTLFRMNSELNRWIKISNDFLQLAFIRDSEPGLFIYFFIILLIVAVFCIARRALTVVGLLFTR